MAQIWRTVRVFISSTFNNVQAEWDHLVSVVFPELLERVSENRPILLIIDAVNYLERANPSDYRFIMLQYNRIK